MLGINELLNANNPVELTLLRFSKLRRAGWRAVWRFIVKARADSKTIMAAAHLHVLFLLTLEKCYLDTKDMGVWKTKILRILLVISFIAFIFISITYKAKSIGEEPWSKNNIILVGSIFFITFCFGLLFELAKYIKKKKAAQRKTEIE